MWKQVFGFLDSLKKAVGKANKPDELANLMGTWQEYEMCRSKDDVVLFAR